MPHKRVLVVDDEEDIRDVAGACLELTDEWEILTAASGREALQKAASASPDAILLDVMMPDLDGPSTFRILQDEEATRRIPVILLTAKVQSADKQKYLQLGVEGVIAKPFDPMTLGQQIAEILHWA
ncbi:MAG TPA: response regulator [Thermoanaerobaculia bacterium]|nr:response regulator [Thermoanaerobaculia bacterium]